MKNYGKITEGGSINIMPNPYRVVVSNPTEEMKSQLASMFNWLEMVYSTQPEYNPETQYLVEKWEEQSGKAVQVWEVKDKEEVGE